MTQPSGTPSPLVPPHPTRTHTRKTSRSKPAPGHERCQHTWKFMQLGIPPQPTAPWRIMIFKVHCLVTQRWMKIRIPFAWFWYGEVEYGTPEVESGTIAASNPTPPAIGPRLPAGTPLPDDGPQQTEEELAPYQTPKHREPPMRQGAPTLEERFNDLEERLRATEQRSSRAYDASHPQGYGR